MELLDRRVASACFFRSVEVGSLILENAPFPACGTIGIEFGRSLKKYPAALVGVCAMLEECIECMYLHSKYVIHADSPVRVQIGTHGAIT